MKNKEFFWYKLFNTKSFGTKSIYYIYEILKRENLSIIDFFDFNINQLYEIFSELGKGKFSKVDLSNLYNQNEENLLKQYQKLKENKIQIIGLDDERYPKLLLKKMNSNAPSVLFCKGYISLLNSKNISIVGSRNVTEFETTISKNIASILAKNGYNIISGYAKGIDTAAHLGALEVEGTTTMVLSFGTNYISIKKEIRDFDWEKNSLFISPFSPFEKFSGKNAMARNKIICAMSEAMVVVISGPEKNIVGKMSGTYDAGKSAICMEVPTFVLNPNILKSTPEGNTSLINLGGIKFSNGIDIITYLSDEKIYIIETKNNTSVKSQPKNKKITSETKSSISEQTSFNF